MWRASLPSLYIADEKLLLTKAPGAVGSALIKFSPGSLSIANVAGRGLATFGGLASGVLEVASAFMTPFATNGMTMARDSCGCKK